MRIERRMLNLNIRETCKKKNILKKTWPLHTQTVCRYNWTGTRISQKHFIRVEERPTRPY